MNLVPDNVKVVGSSLTECMHTRLLVLVGAFSSYHIMRVRARFLDLRVKSLGIYVWRLPMCRSAQNDICCAQTNPTPDLTLTLTLTLILTPTLWGRRGLLGVGSRSAGVVLPYIHRHWTCKYENHARSCIYTFQSTFLA